MTFLYRLAQRIARLKAPILAVTSVTLACSQGERTDFLSPVPHQPSSNIRVVRIEPKIAAIQAGMEFRFNASALNEAGSVVATTFDWLAESGSISSDGRYVGVVPGPFKVIVRAHDRPELSDTAVVAVWQNETDPTGISIQPATISIEEGDTLTFSAFLNLANGVQAAGATVDWNSTGGDINTSGLFTAPLTEGLYLVSARMSNGYTATASVQVQKRRALITKVEIGPKTANLTPYQGMQFGATTTYSDGRPGPGLYLWSTDFGSITQTGVFTSPGGVGIARITVNAIGTNLTDTALVQVNAEAPSLASLRVSPDPVTVQAGGAQQFSADGTWSDGSTGRPVVMWSATGGSITTSGRYTAGSLAGSYRVIALHQGGTLADTATVTVPPPTVLALGITPRYASVMPGSSQQFTASATWSNGSTVLPALTWSTNGGTVSSNGLFTAGATTGTYRVIVAGGGRADTATVSIGAPRTLVSLSLNPEAGQTTTGSTIQFTAAALWSDGSNTLPSLSWSATGGTITSTGSYTAGPNAGTYRVIVSGAGKSDTAAMTVSGSNSPPTSSLRLTVGPRSVTLPLGESQYFSVSAVWPDGSTGVPSVSWRASEGTVSSFLTGGYYTPPDKPGTYRVIAVANGAADTAIVTTTVGNSGPGSLTAITLTPAVATVAPGASQTFTASATWSNGSTTLPALTWSATGGTVTQSGLYTAGSSTGTFQVIASGGGKADTAVVTVSNAPVVTLTNLSLTPGSTSLVTDGSQQFTVSAQWSNGATNLPTLTWSATGGTISQSGLYSAGSNAGAYWVIVSGGGKADTADVTLVTPSAPPSGGQYPNRPGNFTRVVSDMDFNIAPPTYPNPVPTWGDERGVSSTGWSVIFDGNGSGGSDFSRLSDALAPTSSVWQLTQRAGYYGGCAPSGPYPACVGSGGGAGFGNLGRAVPGSSVYVAMRIRWSPGYYVQPISHKFLRWFDGHLICHLHNNARWFYCDSDGAINYYDDGRALVTSQPDMTGGYHLVEVLIIGGNPGTFKLWYDGVLRINSTDRPVPNTPTPVNTFSIDGHLGGGGFTLLQDQWYRLSSVLVVTP